MQRRMEWLWQGVCRLLLCFLVCFVCLVCSVFVWLQQCICRCVQSDTFQLWGPTCSKSSTLPIRHCIFGSWHPWGSSPKALGGRGAKTGEWWASRRLVHRELQCRVTWSFRWVFCFLFRCGSARSMFASSQVCGWDQQNCKLGSTRASTWQGMEGPPWGVFGSRQNLWVQERHQSVEHKEFNEDYEEQVPGISCQPEVWNKKFGTSTMSFGSVFQSDFAWFCSITRFWEVQMAHYFAIDQCQQRYSTRKKWLPRPSLVGHSLRPEVYFESRVHVCSSNKWCLLNRCWTRIMKLVRCFAQQKKSEVSEVILRAETNCCWILSWSPIYRQSSVPFWWLFAILSWGYLALLDLDLMWRSQSNFSWIQAGLGFSYGREHPKASKCEDA